MASEMTDYHDVMKYELTEKQKKKNLGILLESVFENVEASVAYKGGFRITSKGFGRLKYPLNMVCLDLVNLNGFSKPQS